MKKSILFLLVVSLLLVLTSSVCAEVTWPTEDILVYVPASPGGGTDAEARLVAEYFHKYTGKNMIVENQTSGSGTVSYEMVRNAKPDGNTLLYYHTSLQIAYYSGIYGHNPAEVFKPIAKIADCLDNALCVPANSPYNTMDELVAAAKEKPGSLIAGISIAGFPEYLIKLLEKDGECTFRQVDAGNSNDRLVSLIGGHIDVAIINAANAIQYEKNGDLKVLAICHTERVPQYPEWPSVTEQGYPGVVIPNSMFLYAPEKIDAELAKAMNEVFMKIGQDPEFQQDTYNLGLVANAEHDLESTAVEAGAVDSNIKALFELL